MARGKKLFQSQQEFCDWLESYKVQEALSDAETDIDWCPKIYPCVVVWVTNGTRIVATFIDLTDFIS